MAHEFEFFGPHGPGLLVLVLPLVVYGLVLGCNADDCLSVYPKLHIPSSWPKGVNIFSVEATAVYLGWFFLVTVLHLILPGKKVKGTAIKVDEKSTIHLTYKLNAFLVFVITYGGALYLGFFTPYLDLGWVYGNFTPLLTASVIFSTLLSVYVYAASFMKGKILSSHGDTGYPIYDFWMGRELNPRIGNFDLKEFCELYPGIIGWVVLNLSLAYKQQQNLGYITNSMYLVNAFQLYYAVDALWNESSILTTMDITTDGFGFMLSFGDLAWVPFTFTTATRFLVDYPQDLSVAGVALVLGVKLLGYYIFRGANGQKDVFRRDPTHPSVSHLKTLKTERGTQLIVSGWWGTARHINYFGDWIMGVAWCMPTGFAGLTAVLPYFYCIYFASLLIHREMRDEASCRKKYGKDWDKYCKIVRWKIIPFVY